MKATSIIADSTLTSKGKELSEQSNNALLISSKKKYKWSFALENKDHYLELEFSYLSGKRKLILDGKPLHESMLYIIYNLYLK